MSMDTPLYVVVSIDSIVTGDVRGMSMDPHSVPQPYVLVSMDGMVTGDVQGMSLDTHHVRLSPNPMS